MVDRERERDELGPLQAGNAPNPTPLSNQCNNIMDPDAVGGRREN
jgi:hypothetical protein